MDLDSMVMIDSWIVVLFVVVITFATIGKNTKNMKILVPCLAISIVAFILLAVPVLGILIMPEKSTNITKISNIDLIFHEGSLIYSADSIHEEHTSEVLLDSVYTIVYTDDNGDKVLMEDILIEDCVICPAKELELYTIEAIDVFGNVYSLEMDYKVQ